MAVRAYAVANPTNADITVNAKVAKANAVTSLSFDDAALSNGWTDLANFLLQGCAVLNNEQVTNESQKQQAGYLLHMEEWSV